MDTLNCLIRSLDKNSSQSEFEALNRYNNQIRRERLPDDPPIPLEETIQNIKSIPQIVDLRLWVTWSPDSNEIVALGDVVFLRTEENQHLGQFELSVLPQYRRQGLGRKLLSLIAEAADQEKRRLLMTSTTDRVPGGEAFMLRLGAKKGLSGHTNQLHLSELDRGLLEDWLRRGHENLGEFELGFWEGPYPEEQIQAICELYDLTNQQPFGDLEIEDMKMNPEQLRQMEGNLFARGYQRWTYYLIDRTTGKFVGYTETAWNPNRPENLRQDMTGVFPQYRNKGLGRWLKAAMLDKVLRDRPEVKYVRTGNADSNAAMLKINHALGFKPYIAETMWQVEVQNVLDYLQARQQAGVGK